MRIRLSRKGLALLAVGSLSSISLAGTQVLADEPLPIPASVRSQKSPTAEEQRAKEDKEDEMQQRSMQRNRYRDNRPKKVHDADPWKKNPPIWSVRDETKTEHPYAHPSAPAPGIGHYPGGPTGHFGFPYYYTAMTQDTAYQGGSPGYPLVPGIPPTIGGGPGYAPAPVVDIHATPSGPAYAGGYGAAPGYAGNFAGGIAPGYAGGVGPGYAPGYGGPNYGGPAYGVAGYGQTPGMTVAARPGQLPGNPYLYHFGPGFYRHQEAGHYSFPYYSYRRPWYFQGHPSYNRDTNIPW